MRRAFGLNPNTRLYVEMIQASRRSLLSGRISFLGNAVDRRTRPIRFWAEWAVQALLLAMVPLALFSVFMLATLFG